MPSFQDRIYLLVDPSNIDCLNRILEGYEHLGVLSTLDRQRGLMVVLGTTDTYQDLLHVLDHLPFDILIQSDHFV
jgi:putative protease